MVKKGSNITNIHKFNPRLPNTKREEAWLDPQNIPSKHRSPQEVWLEDYGNKTR